MIEHASKSIESTSLTETHTCGKSSIRHVSHIVLLQSLLFACFHCVRATAAIHWHQRRRQFDECLSGQQLFHPESISQQWHVSLFVGCERLHRWSIYPIAAAARIGGRGGRPLPASQLCQQHSVAQPGISVFFTFRDLGIPYPGPIQISLPHRQPLYRRRTFLPHHHRQYQISLERGSGVRRGLDIHALLLRVSPEIRYTRWDSDASAIAATAVPAYSNQNQVEFLVGIAF